MERADILIMKKRRVKGPRVRFSHTENYIADAINNVVSWVESLPRLQEIKAGPNIFIRQDDETCIIESTAAPVAAGGAVASVCSFGLEKFDVDSTTGTFRLRATGGLINGLIPTNFQDIGQFSDNTSYYLSIKATTGTTGITALEFMSSTTPPGIQPQVAIGSPPDTFSILAAYINEGEVKTILCSDIQANPTVYSYDYDNAGNATIKWWWQISSFYPFSNNTSTT